MLILWESFGFLKYTGGGCVIFSEWRELRRWWRARSSVCARKAGASVNGISRKQQRLRACSGRAGVNGRANMLLCAWIGRLGSNGRAQGGRVAGKRLRESRSPIFKFKSSLKTSAIASNAVIVGVREAPCTTGRSSKGQLQQQRVM